MPSAPQAYSSPRRTKTASEPHGESRADLEWRSRTLLVSTHPALERFRFLLSRTWLSQKSCLLPALRPLPARPAATPGCRRRFDSHVRVEVFARRSKDGHLVCSFPEPATRWPASDRAGGLRNRTSWSSPTPRPALSAMGVAPSPQSTVRSHGFGRWIRQQIFLVKRASQGPYRAESASGGCVAAGMGAPQAVRT